MALFLQNKVYETFFKKAENFKSKTLRNSQQVKIRNIKISWKSRLNIAIIAG